MSDSSLYENEEIWEDEEDEEDEDEEFELDEEPCEFCEKLGCEGDCDERLEWNRYDYSEDPDEYWYGEDD